MQARRIALIEQQSLGSTSAHMTDADAAGTELERSQSEPAPPRDEFAAMGLAARDLDRLERYERRALSRRKRAIEMYMAISNTPPSPAPGGLPAL